MRPRATAALLRRLVQSVPPATPAPVSCLLADQQRALSHYSASSSHGSTSCWIRGTADTLQAQQVHLQHTAFGAARFCSLAQPDSPQQPSKQQQEQQQQQGEQPLSQQAPTSPTSAAQHPPGTPATAAAEDATQAATAADADEQPLPPAPSYQELLQSERAKLSGSSGFHLDALSRSSLNGLVKRFQGSGAVRDSARSDYINAELFPRAAAAFRKFLLRAANQPLIDHLMGLSEEHGGYCEPIEQLLYSYFAEYVHRHYDSEVARYKEQVSTLDMRAPHTWYPYARAIKRRIIYHAGPTNSGKTYTALQALRAAKRGVYCGPLRLLAMEVYETLNTEGYRCSLVTGQEKQEVPGAAHVSATVEMVSLTDHADVAVIDEIQMIADDQRGHAWTRALLGLPANELHVCGDATAMSVVRQLAAECGDEFEVQHYDRFTPLVVEQKALPNGWADVAPGDCIVAFSRRAIYTIRKEVEAASGERACIVYGALPAETRRAQARLFNDPTSNFKVLIASDAVGMGLNFNIRRVIFASMRKPVGRGGVKGPVPPGLVKQIAGRAGRRNSAFPEGTVTTLQRKDLPSLKAGLETPLAPAKAAGLVPEFETIELLAGQLPGLKFDQLLAKFAAEAQLDGLYFFCNQDELLTQAKLLQRVTNLSLEDRFIFCMAPLPRGDARCEACLLEFAHSYAKGHPVAFNGDALPKGPPKDDVEMAALESWHRVLSLWLWLSFRFEDGTFPGREKVVATSAQLCSWMNEGLMRSTMRDNRTTTDAGSMVGNGTRSIRQQQEDEEAASSSGDEALLELAATAGSNGSTDSSSSSGSRAPASTLTITNASSNPRRAAAPWEAELQQLLAPSFDPSMVHFIKSTRTKLVVPPPPAQAVG